MKQTRRINTETEILWSDGLTDGLLFLAESNLEAGYPYYEILTDGDRLRIQFYKLHKETDAEEEAREKREAGLP